MRRLVLTWLAVAVACAGCDAVGGHGTAWVVPGGDPVRGREVFHAEGCGACHATPGWGGSRGAVGPPLDHVADRAFIAGVLPNTPENLMHWIARPQSVVAGNAMPDNELEPGELRDLAAYLYTLR